MNQVLSWETIDNWSGYITDFLAWIAHGLYVYVYSLCTMTYYIVGKTKPTYIYKTADELIAKGSKRKVKDGSKSKQPQVKVIDMTGREQRVLSGEFETDNL